MSHPRGRSGVRVPCSPYRGGNGNSTHYTRGGTAGNPHRNRAEQPGTGSGNSQTGTPPEQRWEQHPWTAFRCLFGVGVHTDPLESAFLTSWSETPRNVGQITPNSHPFGIRCAARAFRRMGT